MSKILRSVPLSHPWPGTDPFLFCAHHVERYPAANEDQGVPKDKLAGRPLGNDFSRKDGFSMYYGDNVPGFPAHPHRGFETVTIVSEGLVDHADSLGATARYGDGDVQWLTAGRGVMHAETFPLRHRDGENRLDLYQIWLNLPARSKMVEPAFAMLWDGTILRYETETEPGAKAVVKVVAGAYQPQETTQPALLPPAPAPNSYASEREAEVAIWQIHMAPGSRLQLPAASRSEVRRTLYFHAGDRIECAGLSQSGPLMIEVLSNAPLDLRNVGREAAEILVLQGLPIGEEVVAHGPFVMNSQAEIIEAHQDYRQTRFGGWPWPAPGPVHPAGHGRFARQPGSDEQETPPG